VALVAAGMPNWSTFMMCPCMRTDVTVLHGSVLQARAVGGALSAAHCVVGTRTGRPAECVSQEMARVCVPPPHSFVHRCQGPAPLEAFQQAYLPRHASSVI
jgi:hypothetical protein